MRTGVGNELGSSRGDGRHSMNDTWLILLGMPIAFFVGGLLGYRLGFIAGLDKSQRMIQQIVEQELRAQRARREPPA